MSSLNTTNCAETRFAGSDDEISRALVGARSTATPLDGFPGEIPASMEQAYAIQSASIARWPDQVGGWKVGYLPAAAQSRYSTERLAGPIFRSQIHEVSNGSHNVMPVFVGGFAALEAEFIYQFSQDVNPGDGHLSDEGLLARIASLHIGVEIASSPMADINRLGPTVVASDFGNNAGLLVGPAIPDWQSAEPGDLPVKSTVNGTVVGESSAAAIPGGPIAALRFVVALCAERNIPLPAGTLVSTGACTGIHDVEAGFESRVEFGRYGCLDVAFAPMAPRQ